jgi:hypothetical protein
MQIKTNQYRAIDLDLIQDQAFQAAVTHMRLKREGKAKREALRLRKEQNRQQASILAVEISH